jgi:glycosyltransferase involved in cell wall biosynthesis
VSRRIVHVVSTHGVGGAERIIAAIVQSGHTAGWEQRVLNFFGGDGAEAFAALCDPVRTHMYGCRRVTDLPGVRQWVKRQLDDFRPDLLHVVLFPALAVTATIPRGEATARIVTQVYGNYLHGQPYAWATERFDRWATGRFDKIVAISDSVQDYLVREQRHPSSKVVRISPGWSGTPLPPSRDDARPTIVCVAKFRPEKGHTVLLAAFERVRKEISSARLVLVGDGELEEQLRDLVATRGLDESVHFAGSVEEVWPVLATAHVFALASLAEAFGIAVVEAMAAGLPVVVPAVGGLPELVQPGVGGELFPPGDETALAAVLIRLLLSADLRERMGEAGRRAAEPYKMYRTAARYLALYDEVLDDRDRAQTP